MANAGKARSSREGISGFMFDLPERNGADLGFCGKVKDCLKLVEQDWLSH